MLRGTFLSLVMLAVASVAPEIRAAEIKNECPSINDQGGRLRIRTLLPASLAPIETRQEPVKGYEDNPNYFGLQTIYWRPGAAPITDAVFHCMYDKGSSLDIPIIGILLRCERPDSRHFQRKEELPLSCISETDPGLLRGK